MSGHNGILKTVGYEEQYRSNMEDVVNVWQIEYIYLW